MRSRLTSPIQSTRLRAFPEIGGGKVLDGPDGVETPTTFSCEFPGVEGTGEDRSSWGRGDVTLAEEEEDQGADQEDTGWEGVGQPETDVLERLKGEISCNRSWDRDELTFSA